MQINVMGPIVRIGSGATFNARLFAPLAKLRIGGNAVFGEYFRGIIDEVRLYNRPLTAADIQVDMNTPIQ